MPKGPFLPSEFVPPRGSPQPTRPISVIRFCTFSTIYFDPLSEWQRMALKACFLANPMAAREVCRIPDAQRRRLTFRRSMLEYPRN